MQARDRGVLVAGVFAEEKDVAYEEDYGEVDEDIEEEYLRVEVAHRAKGSGI